MFNISKKDGKFYAIYLLGFLFAAHLALPAYINSTFLSQYSPEKFVGILYTIGSIVTMFILAIMPFILRRFGNYRTMLVLSIADIILLLGLATFKTIILLAPIFILTLVIVTLIYLNLDVFLESNSSDGHTGSIRGKYLTSMNFAWVISPMIAGFILTNGDYWKIYLTAAGLMTIAALLLVYSQKSFKDPKYDRVPFWKTFMQVKRRANIYRIFMANFLLRFFYSWMVIYTPIYLHEYMGFDWSSIGIMFTIMLLPFVLLEIPVGKLADSKWGEKEFLTIGFVIIAISTVTLSFMTSTSLILWVTVLLVTRIGASIIEIMTETYFFKQIDGTDTNILGFYRNSRPLAYTIAPIIASGLLIFIDYKYLFIILGTIMFLGLRYSLTLKDTL